MCSVLDRHHGFFGGGASDVVVLAAGSLSDAVSLIACASYSGDLLLARPLPRSPRIGQHPAMGSLFPRLSLQGDAVALVVDGEEGPRSIGYRALAGACVAHAERMAKLGVSPGDRVAVFTDPALETMVTLVANAAMGFVTVPIDPKLGTRELEHIAKDADPAVAIASDPGVVSGRLGAVTTVRAEIGAGDASLFSPRPVMPTPMLVLYTSGTTGAPKGALISAENVAFALDALASAWDWTHGDTIVHALPLFHVHGLVLGLYGAMRRGGALHWVPRFSASALAGALLAASSEGDRSAVLFAVPTIVHRLLEAAESEPAVRGALASARLLVSGSAALPVREQERAQRLVGRGFVERYGMTETLITCAVRAKEGARPGLVGRPLDGVEIRLVDDARAPLDAHDDETIGEIAVRGPLVFLGYLNRDDATREVRDEAGWLYTGDLATRTADGAIRVVGRRATDLIKCGGFKIGAGEIEGALLEHPSVREAAVVGAPDPDLGERIVAFVVTREPTEAEALIDHVARLLSPHKRPREVRFVSALPRNAMGKVQKKLLTGAP
jgi:malonyl-CoA/methylmalonyl-CoA synthetase